ncbi:Immunoglobulin-like and fibronectin type III domain-containing protein 1 [Liparis tanakae]|nr:Immunoglobulin-like and fibronectin type III domain-containing protein 1 [Liparis tanakae]
MRSHDAAAAAAAEKGATVGKKVFFKAMVSGEPAPAVTWGRNKGEVDDPEKYTTRYDERAQEHVLEVRKPSLNTTLDSYNNYI